LLTTFDAHHVTLLPTADVQQVRRIAKIIRCTSYYIANNWRTAVMLLPRPDVVQATLLPTADVKQVSCIANNI
jgi:hypothetical protein